MYEVKGLGYVSGMVGWIPTQQTHIIKVYNNVFVVQLYIAHTLMGCLPPEVPLEGSLNLNVGVSFVSISF